MKIVLEDSGIDPGRFAVEWVSSAEAPRFAEKVSAFTEKIKALGPCKADSRGHAADYRVRAEGVLENSHLNRYISELCGFTGRTEGSLENPV